MRKTSVCRPEGPSCCTAFFVRTRSGVFSLLLLLAFAALNFPSHQGYAVCLEQQAVLHLPVPATSQAHRLYGLLAESWNYELKQFGQPSLELRSLPGRGGSYALSSLLDLPAQGCYLGALQMPSFLLLTRTANRMFEPADIAPVAILASAPLALWVNEDSPFYTVADLVRFVRAATEIRTDEPHGRAEIPPLPPRQFPVLPDLPLKPSDRQAVAPPGYELSIAGIGSFTEQHMAGAMLDRLAGIRSHYLPVLGSAEAVEAVKSHQVIACWGYALAGRSMPGMRAIGVAASGRSPVLPDTPTFQEQNIDMVLLSYFGIGMSAAARDTDRQEISDSFAALAAHPDTRESMRELGFSPRWIPYAGMADFLEEREQELQDFLLRYPDFARLLTPRL